MDLRTLVTGADACTPDDGAGPSNAAASFADALLGRSAKQAQQLSELPGVQRGAPALRPYQPPTAAQAAQAALHGELPAVPGLAPSSALQADVDAFLRGAGPAPAAPEFQEFESIYSGSRASGAGLMPAPGMAPSSSMAVAPSLRAFVASGRTHLPFQPLPLAPGLALSVEDARRLRDRSTIMARHLFADRGPQFADEQVGKLLASLGVNPLELPAPQGPSWDAIYASAGPRGLALPSPATDHAAGAAMAAAHPQQGQWVEEFAGLDLGGQSAEIAAAAGPSTSGAWASEFEQQQQQQQRPRGSWAEQYEEEQRGGGWADEFVTQAAAGVATRQRAAAQGDALEQTRRLADTLAANKDPKFQNSKFLQFLSKMSRGEVILEDNQAKEVPAQAAAWVSEFGEQQQQARVLGEERAPFQMPGWVDEYERDAHGRADWADEFASGLAGGGEWAEQFAAEAPAAGTLQQWEEEYFQELERLHSAAGPRTAGEYVMCPDNPFLLDTESFAKGRELFRRGVLTEAVLALEAECQRNPSNAEAWRLLGTVQAENDDDHQAIAAMNRALSADPTNLEVLLALGVSHTNELEQGEAAGYLRQWVLRHPTYGTAAAQVPKPPDSSQNLTYVTRLFEEAARLHPEDPDLHTALGVVYNLSRQYESAVEAFRAALSLRPQDYSLWNKLGATLANSSHSAEAVGAYQKALDLKPNYMRAWTNMGISQANLADYEASARFYVRALALNPRASSVWGYLRTSIACAGRADLMDAVDREDLAALQAALPL